MLLEELNKNQEITRRDRFCWNLINLGGFDKKKWKIVFGFENFAFNIVVCWINFFGKLVVFQ